MLPHLTRKVELKSQNSKLQKMQITQNLPLRFWYQQLQQITLSVPWRQAGRKLPLGPVTDMVSGSRRQIVR